MKLCVDCKHFSPSVFCKSPRNGLSPMDGKPVVRSAIAERKANGLCGPNGNYFEPIYVDEKEVPSMIEVTAKAIIFMTALGALIHYGRMFL